MVASESLFFSHLLPLCLWSSVLAAEEAEISSEHLWTPVVFLLPSFLKDWRATWCCDQLKATSLNAGGVDFLSLSSSLSLVLCSGSWEGAVGWMCLSYWLSFANAVNLFTGSLSSVELGEGRGRQLNWCQQSNFSLLLEANTLNKYKINMTDSSINIFFCVQG